MPTPVSSARQCLADEAAAALDDAVSVAKRRGHVQTTSLHAVSALLSFPSSLLRDACSRASGRGGACPPRLQLRALDLCVGVALDRVPTSKCRVEDNDPPPVSNSLMAAIKRSQANQRRNPETFHLYQQQQMMNPDSNPNSSFNSSFVRVDLKNFLVSILDDPIVSRVFGDAGFRTQEIKCAVLNPNPILRFPGFSPLIGDFRAKSSDNTSRIGEVMSKKERKNPLLIGACANDALKGFLEDVKRREIVGHLERITVVSMESDFSEFLEGGVDEEVISRRYKEVCEMVGSCAVLLSFGDMKVFVNAEISMEKLNYVVGETKKLLGECSGRLWWIGVLGGDGDYKQLLERFPKIEMDWDLQLMPITSYTSSGGKSFKSSLMGSFVPLGGFFPLPSEREIPCTRTVQSPNICSSCNQKYEQEVTVLQKAVSAKLDGDHHTITLSPWLKTSDQAKDVKTSMDTKIAALWRKWTDICQQLHHSWTSKEYVSSSKTQDSSVLSLQDDPIRRDAACMDSTLNTSEVSNPSHCTALDLNHSLQKQTVPEAVVPDTSLRDACTLSVPVTSVATQLGLGTIYSCGNEVSGRLNSHVNQNGVSNSLRSSRVHELNHRHVSILSSSSQWEILMGKKDLEYPWKVLAEKLYWQIEAIETISQTLTCHRTSNGVYTFSNKGNIWLSFLGPDKLGKKNIAYTVAEIVFGSKKMLLSFDLSSKNCVSNGTIFDRYDSISHRTKSERKMMVDFLAEELNKLPGSVAVLDNLEKADPLVQNSLVQAVKTGRFRDSHGRDINIKNKVFILISSFGKSREDDSCQVASEYSEEEIAAARDLQMQISVASPNETYCRNSSMKVSVSTSDEPSNQWPVKKRKLMSNMPINYEMSRSIIDLNLPVEDTEDDCDVDKHEYDSDNFESSENPDPWLNKLLEHVDENVHFKSLNCDSFAEKILKKIDMRVTKVVGPDTFLKIDRQVMHQIVAAALLMDSEVSLDDWIENVLCPSIKEVRQRRNDDTPLDTVVKLVSCDGVIVEEQAHGLCLPAKIRIN